MTNLNDEQLILLEQLAYLNDGDIENPTSSITNMTAGKTVKDLISPYVKSGKYPEGEFTSKEEWEAIINAINEDEELKSLQLERKDNDSGTYCFKDKEGEAIVIFMGTATGEEWVDNFKGMAVADTEAQRQAARFVNELPYDDITLVGHSKGGNKVMYCAIVCDDEKVGKAVAMDGQGFSREFLNKYEAEISAKGGKVKNYSLDTDFVNILMYQPESIEQIYIEHDPSVKGGKNHAPQSLLHFKNGRVEYEGGKPAILKYRGLQNEGMSYLHDCTCFIIDNCPTEDRLVIGEYLGNIVGVLLKDGWSFHDGGEEYARKDLLDYITKYPDKAGMALAYIAKYVEVNNLSDDQILALLDSFGLKEVFVGTNMAIDITKYDFGLLGNFVRGTELTVDMLLLMLIKNIMDGKRDPWLEYLIEHLGGDYGSFASTLWINIEKEYHKIGEVDKATHLLNTMEVNIKTYDYSQEAYNIIIETMNKIDSLTSGNINSWDANYSSEKWYGGLSIPMFIGGINLFTSKLTEVNNYCRKETKRIFDTVVAIDRKKAQEAQGHIETVKTIVSALSEMAGNIG